MKEKIKVEKPIVEIDGDEMARVMWQMIKDRFIKPYLDLDIKYYDLHIEKRDETNDEITLEAAKAIEEYGVGIKCATITPNEQRVEEFDLKKQWPSPNGTIRNYLGGTIFRGPIIMENIPKLVPAWKKPIIVARHAFADRYDAAEMNIDESGELNLEFEGDDGKQTQNVHNFDGKGIAMSIYNTRESIRNFARACFNYALEQEMPLYLSTKDTILKKYDSAFREEFEKIYEDEFEHKFDEKGISYNYRLIDDMVARALKMEGGFIWALKNYDGDVQSDMIAQGFGSLALLTSQLRSADGETIETEAAHGTVTRHYRRWQKGEETSTNPIASIFAWTRGLKERARLDDNDELDEFCEKLENTCIETVESGNMTKDLVRAVQDDPDPDRDTWLSTEEFFGILESNFKDKLNR